MLQIGVLMICLFVASWLPYAVIAELGVSGYAHLVNPYSAMLPIMFAKASFVWNPVVYALGQPRYRAAIVRLLPRSGAKRANKYVCTFKLQRLGERKLSTLHIADQVECEL
jgi:hypothetical protein